MNSPSDTWAQNLYIWLQQMVKELTKVGEILLKSAVLFFFFGYGRLPPNYFTIIGVNMPRSPSYNYVTISAGVYWTKILVSRTERRAETISSHALNCKIMNFQFWVNFYIYITSQHSSFGICNAWYHLSSSPYKRSVNIMIICRTNAISLKRWQNLINGNISNT